MADWQWKIDGMRGAAIALDGGTTNTRARLLWNGSIIAVARRSVGARDTLLEQAKGELGANAEPSSGKERLADAIKQVIEEVVRRGAAADPSGGVQGCPSPELIIAAGMLSSDVGLVAVPHVPAPAGIDELGRGVMSAYLPRVCERPIQFIPGVRTPASDGIDGWIDADVMRGEECETIGAMLALSGSGQLAADTSQAFVWPGSHTKLVEVDGRGRITRSHTSLAGELLQAVSKHTLLVASLPATLPEELDREAAETGARVVMQQGLGRAAFLVRIAALSESLDPVRRASFLVGAVVADDVAHLRSHPILMPGRTVWVGGRQPLRSLYAEWLGRQHTGPVVAIDDWLAESASAIGSLAIASRSVERLTGD